jgi:hypothetical protein
MRVREIPAVAERAMRLNEREEGSSHDEEQRSMGLCMGAVSIHHACRTYPSRRKRAFACKKKGDICSMMKASSKSAVRIT